MIQGESTPFPITSARLRALEEALIRLRRQMEEGRFGEKLLQEQSWVIAEVRELRLLLEAEERLRRQPWQSWQIAVLALMTLILSLLAVVAILWGG